MVIAALAVVAFFAVPEWENAQAKDNFDFELVVNIPSQVVLDKSAVKSNVQNVRFISAEDSPYCQFDIKVFGGLVLSQLKQDNFSVEIPEPSMFAGENPCDDYIEKFENGISLVVK